MKFRNSTFYTLNSQLPRGDGPSALADPRFIASSGERYRVTLLIGKTYRVTCQMPIFCVGKSDDEITVSYGADDCDFSICWPVEISADEIQTRGGTSFSMSVLPDCLGGDFVWTNCCCSVSSRDGVFTYSCGDTCTCSGCAAHGYYRYEGYRLGASGITCGCEFVPNYTHGGPQDDDGPYDAGASASFSKHAVIFEDRYENTPGVWVERHSTKTELRCVAHGGPNGGHVRFEMVGEDKLERVSGNCTFPFESDVGAGKKIDFKIEYNGKQPSYTANDIVVTSTFTENVEGAEAEQDEAKLTCVKVELTSSAEAVENRVRTRHVYGVAEIVNRRHYPSGVPVTWLLNGAALNGDTFFSCPPFAQEGGLIATTMGAEYSPAITVVEPSGVVCRTADVDPISYMTPFGVAGRFAMILDNITLLPLDVSFGRLYVEEVPTEDATRYGYFDQTYFATNSPSHYYGQGAGLWVGVSDNNVLRIRDRVSVGEAPMPWSHGGMIWPIPMGWHTNNVQLGTMPLKNIPANVCAVYTMLSAEGTIIVSKLNHWISRGTNCVVTLDGEVLNGSE